MIVELAKVEDAKEILNLQKLAYESEAEIYSDYTIPPLTQTLEEIITDFENQVFLKASVEEKIISSVRAYMEQETCSIGRLIVHPSFQGQGIGTKLMNEIEGHFNTAKRFELFTGHRSERNIYLYQKLGYQVFRRVIVNKNLNLVYMEKLHKAT
jgi:ribosomal protein S18 acetylase RimI-like enzyme